MEPQEIVQFYKFSVDSGETRTTIEGEMMQGHLFEGYEFHCVDWSKCDLSGTVWIECDLRGCDFSSSRMDGAKFVRCKLFDCNIPEGANIKIVKCTNEAFSRVDSHNERIRDGMLAEARKLITSIAHMPLVNLLAFGIIIALVTVIVAIIRLT